MIEISRQFDLTDLFAAGKLPDDPFRTDGFSSVVELVSLNDSMSSAFNSATADKSDRFVSTGIKVLDDRFGLGFERGSCQIVGAYTSQGKSTLSLGIADTLIRSGGVSLIVSLEDSYTLYGRRVLSMRTGIPAKTLRTGGLSSEQLTACAAAIAQAEPFPFFLNARGKTVEEIAMAIKWVASHYKLKLVVIDYLQKLTTKQNKANRTAELEYSAHALSDMICNLDIVGILVSQLTGDKDELPSEGNVRDCRSIANAAENIILLWKNMTGETVDARKRVGSSLLVPSGGTLAIVPKVKDGGCTGADLLEFSAEKQKFVDPNDYSHLVDGFDDFL